MDHSQPKRVCGRIGWSLVVFLLVQQFAAAMLMAALMVTDPGVMERDWFLLTVTLAATYVAAFPFLWVLMKTIPDAPRRAEGTRPLSPAQFVLVLLASFGVGYPLAMLSEWLSSTVGQLTGNNAADMLDELLAGSNPWIALIYVVLVGPIMEEVIFRWLLYQKLIPYGGRCYLLFSGLAFGLFHGNLYQIPYAFVLGMLFAAITAYTGSVGYTIAIHILFNFLGGGAAGLVEAYGGEGALAVLESATTLFIIAGVLAAICLAVILLSRRLRVLSPPAIPIPKRQMFLNPGMIVFFCLTALITITSLFL